MKKAVEATRKMYEAMIEMPDKSKKIIELQRNPIQHRIFSIIEQSD